MAEAYADVGVLGIYAGCAAADAGRLAELVATQIKALTADCGPAELARAKAQLKASLFMARESLLARAEQAAAQILSLGDVRRPSALAAAIDAVSLEDLQDLGARLLASGRSTVSVLGPRAAMNAPARFESGLFT